MHRRTVVAAALVLGALALVFLLDRGESARTESGAGEHSAVRDTRTRHRLRPKPRDASLGDGVTVVVETVAEIGSAWTQVPGVTVTAVGGVEPRSGESPHRAEATSDAEGQAELLLPAEGTWRITAVCAGYFGATQVHQLDTPRSEYTLRLAVIPFSEIRGTVRDAAGDPVAGAVVHVVVPPGSRKRLGPMHAADRTLARAAPKSDAGGSYAIRPVPSSVRMSLEVVAKEVGRVARDVAPLAAGESRSIDVAFPPRTDLVGRIGGDPGLGPAKVTCWQHTDRGSGLRRERIARTEEGGAFSLRALEPGTKTLISMRRHAAVFEVSVRDVDAVAGRKTDTGTIEPGPRTMRIVPLVEGAGGTQRAVEMRLSVIQPEPPYPLYPFAFTVPSDSELVFRGYPEGRLQVEATVLGLGKERVADPEWEVVVASLEPSETGSWEIVIPRFDRQATGAVTAVVTPPPGLTEETTDPRVFVVRDGEVRMSGPSSAMGVRTLTVGRHEPGAYEVHVVANGWVATPVQVEIVGGKSQEAPVSQWVRGVPVSGSVFVAKGVDRSVVRVIVEQKVRSHPNQLQVVEVLSTGIDSDGGFSFPALPRLRALFVRAVTPSGSTAAVPVDADRGASDLEFVVQE